MRIFRSVGRKTSDISGKGAGDEVSHCLLSCFESYGYQMRLFVVSVGRR